MSTATRSLQRLVLPTDRDTDVFPLYVDPEPAQLDADKYEIGTNKNAQAMNNASLRQSVGSGAGLHPDQILGRRSLRVEAGERLSFGTYFNAFPAGYWRRWTIVTDVTLSVTLSGRGSSLTVYRSMANGRSQRVDSGVTENGASTTFTFDLPLKPFVDGGWYWFDVTAGEEDAVVEGADWTAEVPEDRVANGTTTVGITTMNRPDFCAKLLVQIGEDEDLRPFLDEVFVAEQGTDKVADSPIFDHARKALGDRLRVVEQGNLGGSGGYARGQLETVRRGTATYFMCMDDDVVCEPEGIIRAVTFGDLARRPTIVGGHMFSLFSRSRLHSFGEIIQPWRFWWESPPTVQTDWDFGARNLRSARWLHRRIDVDFNGWFMCLIPTQVLRDVGLSLPLFIKWDDSEFGVRAKEAGYPTVTFPGAAVWHVPWTDKNDALDWQSYFHQRNRFVAALLHSPYERGGRMVRESLNHQIKHLVSMQYSTVELRHKALEDVLRGPGALHGDLAGKLPEIRAFAKEFTDARLEADPDAFPPVRRKKPPRKGRDGTEIPGRLSQLVTAGLAPLRQLKPTRDLAKEYPEAEVVAMDAKWYRLARYDSAVVSMPDGTSAALYRRDPERYRDLLKRTVEIHQRLHREWPRLAAEYRDSLSEITAPEAWEATFGIGPESTGGD
ncbi:glycosyltransferase [Nocardioides donggukensis]|uniref:Glycosyltransferase n=1 Tax=Nocardioides donggukensis TaxID=2774019 RepID=A0A927K6H2_9ACTN|nr:glycosyltransferase [Nocardioides donggukensis]MBD8868721.1 glycosyltransferase [Nocardioides donggukensis]